MCEIIDEKLSMTKGEDRVNRKSFVAQRRGVYKYTRR